MDTTLIFLSLVPAVCLLVCLLSACLLNCFLARTGIPSVLATPFFRRMPVSVLCSLFCGFLCWSLLSGRCLTRGTQYGHLPGMRKHERTVFAHRCIQVAITIYQLYCIICHLRSLHSSSRVIRHKNISHDTCNSLTHEYTHWTSLNATNHTHSVQERGNTTQ